ncbi:chaperone for protein-folding within the ER [Multifurca ochricompacta]|uniref:Protein ROT1 n=1 Tax=Multifurca ochricompacta TaxID=376703 RepID=A0AAD4QJX3_9AGAM|nr:chaperone for protein-folding within the ER [Multifurca ochricompacta]
MFLRTLAFLVIASVSALAQITYDSAHNATPIGGTWCSGSQNVVTGSGFANPANLTFVYPKTTGISFSFTETGFYEVARYRMSGNGSSPQCIIAVVNWAHGTFTYNLNGSITLYPFGDGYQQIQSPCAAKSSFIETYNDTELYQSWQIFRDPTDGPKLHLFQFDGAPLPPMFYNSETPSMLPTRPLRNVSSPSPSSSVSKRAVPNSAPPIQRWEAAGFIAVGALLGGALLI